MARDILDLELCKEFIFSEEGMKLFPRAWATNRNGTKFVEHQGKRCEVKRTLVPFRDAIPTRKSGKE